MNDGNLMALLQLIDETIEETGKDLHIWMFDTSIQVVEMQGSTFDVIAEIERKCAIEKK